MDNFDINKQSKLAEIDNYRKEARKNKALLCYKYDTLKFRMNLLQILIIVISTMITFLEAINAHYNFDPTAFNVCIITMSTTIAFIMAIYRFFRIEENKEDIKQSLENHTFIINRLHKIIHSMENFKLINNGNDNNILEWNQLQLSYDGEIFDNYISIKEKFDSRFSFQDSIYYKHKYKHDLLTLEFSNREIQLVDEFKDTDHSAFILRLKGCLYYLLCCINRERIDYTTFIKKAEEGKLVTVIPMSSMSSIPSFTTNKNNNIILTTEI